MEPDQPANPKAYENYLLGRYFWNKRDGGGLEKAIHYFQQSISDDPNYAPAYAGLAQSYELSVGRMGPPQKTLAMARDAAQHALSLNSRLAEAHTALALIRLGEYNFAEEERELRLAIDADPNYSTAHHWYGEACLALFGRFDEANREMQKAMSLDPASRIIATDYAVVLYWQRRYPEAYAQLNHVLEMDPGFSEAYLWRFPSAFATKEIPRCDRRFGNRTANLS